MAESCYHMKCRVVVKVLRDMPVGEAMRILLRPQVQNMNTIYYTVVVQIRIVVYYLQADLYRKSAVSNYNMDK